MYTCNGKECAFLSDLQRDFDCDFLEEREEDGYTFVRVTTDDEGESDSAWYCAECESTDVDLHGAYGAVCYNCEGE